MPERAPPNSGNSSFSSAGRISFQNRRQIENPTTQRTVEKGREVGGLCDDSAPSIPAPTLLNDTALKRYEQANAPAEAKASSFLPMTMRVAPNRNMHLAAQKFLSATEKNTGPTRHPRSGSASTAAAERQVGFSLHRWRRISLALGRSTLCCLWHCGSLRRMEGCLFFFETTY